MRCVNLQGTLCIRLGNLTYSQKKKNIIQYP